MIGESQAPVAEQSQEQKVRIYNTQTAEMKSVTLKELATMDKAVRTGEIRVLKDPTSTGVNDNSKVELAAGGVDQSPEQHKANKQTQEMFLAVVRNRGEKLTGEDAKNFREAMTVITEEISQIEANNPNKGIDFLQADVVLALQKVDDLANKISDTSMKKNLLMASVDVLRRNNPSLQPWVDQIATRVWSPLSDEMHKILGEKPGDY